MRRLSLLAVACVLGCSIPESTARIEPVASRELLGQGPAVAEVARHLRFDVTLTRHASCSRAYQRSTTATAYELSWTAQRTATLHVVRAYDSVLATRGPAPATYASTREEQSYEGTLTRAGAALRIELRRLSAECTKADAEGCATAWTLECVPTTASAFALPAPLAATAMPVDALRCTPGRLPDDLVAAGADDALVFADPESLRLSYEHDRFGGGGAPRLERAQ